jgi:hypothetical protein
MYLLNHQLFEKLKLIVRGWVEKQKFAFFFLTKKKKKKKKKTKMGGENTGPKKKKIALEDVIPFLVPREGKVIT